MEALKKNLILACIVLLLGMSFTILAQAQNFAYVASRGNNNIRVINTAINSVVALVPVGNGPNGIAFTPDGNFAYVANQGGRHVDVIATSSNTVVASVEVGFAPVNLAITPDGAFAYVTNSLADDVSVIATASNSVVATVAVGNQPWDVAITPDGAFAYVTNSLADDVSVIATASNSVVATVAVGGSPRGVAITPDGAFAYVTRIDSQDVSVIATASNTVVATVAMGSAPRAVAITPDGAFAYVAGAAGGVAVIATASNTVVDTVAVGSVPVGIAITPDGAFAYVTNAASRNVSVIATASNTVVATIGGGVDPRGVAITPNPPLVDITVTLSVPVPIIVPAGGSIFDMTVTVDNNSGSNLTAQVWNTVTLLDAGGEEIGPVGGIPVIPISVPAGGQFMTTFFNFEVPGGVRAGNYVFNWKVGTFPNAEFTRDSFGLSKAVGPTLTKAGDDDWGLSPAKEARVPEQFSLEQNYPNPFNPETKIRFQLPEASQVVVRIYNTLGQEIRMLTDREYESGFHSLRWDSMDSNGNAVSSGIYLYQLQAGSFSQIRKMTLLR